MLDERVFLALKGGCLKGKGLSRNFTLRLRIVFINHCESESQGIL